MPKKEESHKHVAVAAVVGKSITSLDIWRAGVLDVIEVNYAGGPYFIKIFEGRIEVGGTADFGTGTMV